MILELFKVSKAIKNGKNLNKIKSFATIKKILVGDERNKDLTTVAEYMDQVKKRNGSPQGLVTTDKVVYLSAKIYAYVKR